MNQATVTYELELDDNKRGAIAATLAAAYPDSYAGFTSNGSRAAFHFSGDAPADLATTLAPYRVNPTDQAIAAAFTSLAQQVPGCASALQQAVSQLTPPTSALTPPSPTAPTPMKGTA